jgi:hypothetical protein
MTVESILIYSLCSALLALNVFVWIGVIVAIHQIIKKLKRK